MAIKMAFIRTCTSGWLGRPTLLAAYLTTSSKEWIVGNQHKWDRLGPEKIIIMKSCV